ncbi:MAG: AraC family transcriptional regulator [Deltaproteobacteria bacterium]|nr:AraC family transcriptional regulator [Deltaproteobacteria bacterium]
MDDRSDDVSLTAPHAPRESGFFPAPQGAHRAEPSVSVRLLWPMVRAVGGDPRAETALGRLGLGGATFASPEGRVPHRVATRFVAEAAASLGDPFLGLRAGFDLDGVDLGAIEAVGRTRATLGDAWDVFVRYFPLLADGMHVEVELHADRALFRLCSGVDGLEPPQVNEFVVAALIGFASRNLAAPAVPLEVHLAHARPPHAADVERRLGAPVRWCANGNAIVVPRAALRVPLRAPNPALSRALELELARELADLRAMSGLLGLVRQAVAAELRVGSVSMAETARKLSMSVATLRRRLAEEGVTWSAVVDDLRRSLADRYLRDTDAAVSEVAFRLGFSDVTSFGRAFRRWAGVSPTEFRAQAAAA